MSIFDPHPNYRVATPEETARMVQDFMASNRAADHQMTAVLVISVLTLLTIVALVGLYREKLRQLPAKASDGAINVVAAGLRVWGNMKRGTKSIADEVKRRAGQ